MRRSINARQRAAHAAHPEKGRAQSKSYQKAHPEWKREAGRKWYAKGRAKIRAKQNAKYANDPEFRERCRQARSAYYARTRDRWTSYHRDKRARGLDWATLNPTAMRATVKGWANRNRGRVRDYVREYRARKANAIGSFTDSEFAQLCERFGNVCLCCRRTRKLTPDHVVPLSRGGSNDISNIQPLCRSCNSSKGARTQDFRS